jgi:hypothetical protein
MAQTKTLAASSLAELREEVLDMLTTHFSRDTIALDEFERRSQSAANADNKAKLLMLVADLPEIEDAEPRKAAPREALEPGGEINVNYGDAPESDHAVNIFFGSSRKGAFKAPRLMSSINIFGGMDIDLREAYIPKEGMTIRALCVFGGLDIKVPLGARLKVKGIGVFGGFDHRSNEPEDPNTPLIVVEGLAVFGGVDVKAQSRKQKKIGEIIKELF